MALSASRATIPHKNKADTPLIVLGNGPSLRRTLTDDLHFLTHNPCMAVNFFANSPEFAVIKPKYYVLADPHFFENAESDSNVAKLVENIRRADWDMDLFVPAKAYRKAKILFRDSPARLYKFNFLAVEGFRWLENLAWKMNLGMPRPRNVLVPALMTGIASGFRRIYLLGADHSWLSTLAVTDDNRVVSIQPHFYTEDKGEKARVQSVYSGIRLHEVLESMTIAFRSYHSIERYARRRGTVILNVTPDSMIDAFERADFSGLTKSSHQNV